MDYPKTAKRLKKYQWSTIALELFSYFKIIHFKLINHDPNNIIACYFWINKTFKLIARKYYWLIFHYNIEIYIKGYKAYLLSKTVYHKLYSKLKLLLVTTYYWKNSSIRFMICLIISADLKNDNYISIFVIINYFTKIIYYKPINVIINTAGLKKLNINVIVRYHGLLVSIISNKGSIFILKFWSLLCYFLNIKWKLSIAFHIQTNR